MGHQLTTSCILKVFTGCVEDLSGSVTDTFDDGSRLFVRSLLPFVEEVRPQDRMQGGLALRATKSEICLHPYLFREVCRNGAIMAHALESWRVELSEYASEYDVIQSLQEAVGACSDRSVFAEQVDRVRASTGDPIDMTITMLSMSSRLPQSLLRQILDHCFEANEPTRFSLMNAITAVARDTPDPEQRWRLEGLGGGVGASILPTRPVDSRGLHLHPGDLVEV